MDIIIWNKTNALPLFNNKYLSDKEYCLYFRKGGYCSPKSYEDAKTVFLYPINIKDKKKWKHPTIKPEALIRKLIRNSSRENDMEKSLIKGQLNNNIYHIEISNNDDEKSIIEIHLKSTFNQEQELGKEKNK